VIALALYVIPDRLALQILVSFGRIGYPTEGRVLRYVEDDPNGLMRAIGLSVDPNSFGRHAGADWSAGGDATGQ